MNESCAVLVGGGVGEDSSQEDGRHGAIVRRAGGRSETDEIPRGRQGQSRVAGRAGRCGQDTR